MQTMTVKEAHETLAEKGCLIDVRTPWEFQEIHAKAATCVPLDEINKDTLSASAQGKGPSLLICKSGKRSSDAAEKLSREGVEDLFVVEGGTDAWHQAGLPVNTGRKAISLERQVRITAGSMALAGVLLGHFVNPAWYWLPGLVGGGFVFSGITDTCAMGTILSKMPWNRKSA